MHFLHQYSSYAMKYSREFFDAFLKIPNKLIDDALDSCHMRGKIFFVNAQTIGLRVLPLEKRFLS